MHPPPVGADAPEPPRHARAHWALLRARLGRRLILEGGVTAGRGVRLAIARHATVVLGDGVELGERSRIEAVAGSVRIGAGTRLGEGVTLAATGGIEIGARSLLGDHVLVVDADPTFADVETPVRLQRLQVAPVRIGAGARIGAHAALLAGAQVGERAVIGSYAVVRGAVPPGAVVTSAS
jgi:carbonic anhydrase/acetyltransferase-like protein (isoleucine patch superfamily)